MSGLSPDTEDMNMTVTVIGAGLAGSEAAWQLAQRGIDVTLCEMKPGKKTSAHGMITASTACSSARRAFLPSALSFIVGRPSSVGHKYYWNSPFGRVILTSYENIGV